MIDKLSLEQKGILLDCIFEYQTTGDYETSDALVDIVATSFVSQFIRDTAKYGETCVNRSKAGRKGGLATQANARSAKQNKQKQANQADSDSDSDSENDSESEKDKTTVGAKAPSAESVWALSASKRLLLGVADTLGRKLTSKPSSAPILKLLKAGVTQLEVAEMITEVVLRSGQEYFPVVQSSKALYEKWDALQNATSQSKPKPQVRTYSKTVVPDFV